MVNRGNWYKSCLEHIPHGEEGRINLPWEDAITWAKILNKKGYAVLFTSGDFEGEVNVAWLYAGSTENLDWADYDGVIFASTDYLDDYVDAYNEEYGKEMENIEVEDIEEEEWTDEDGKAGE